MKSKCDGFVLAAMTPIVPEDIGVSMREAVDWRFQELMIYGGWKLPDSRQIGLMGERLYLENGPLAPVERAILQVLGLRIYQVPNLKSAFKFS